MNDVARMRGGERAGDLKRPIDGLIDRRSLGPQVLIERLAGHVFHDNHRPAFELDDVVNRRDAGMRQRCGRARFAEEVLGRISPVTAEQRLDRNVAVQARVVSEIHLAHAARAKRREDLVRTNSDAGGQGQGGGQRL
jgi:hypothetical protein